MAYQTTYIYQTSKLLTPPPPVTLNTTLESLKYELHFSIVFFKLNSK